MKLIHAGIPCTSIEHAEQFFEELLGLEYSREYTVPSDLIHQLFGISHECMVRLYEMETGKLEVFIASWLKRPSPLHSPLRQEEEEKEFSIPEYLVNHLCIQVEDRKTLIHRSKNYGFWVFEKEREGKPDIVFIYDHDGNPFEIIQ